MSDLLDWALLFLIIGFVAAASGFSAVAGMVIEGARLQFWVAIVLFVVAFMSGLISRRGVLRSNCHALSAKGV